ncbi:hypothetical protein V2J09_006388 [Rumex salicifolius]
MENGLHYHPKRPFSAVSILAVLGGYIYNKFLRPPPPSVAGSPNGPPVTSPRIRLSDGRHLAFRGAGVRKEEAKYRIIVVHGFNDSKDLTLPVSRELVEELKIYFLHFDRAGYGESDPDPKHTVEDEAFDIEQLADALELGPKFYVIGILAGVSLVVPFVHYWWPCFPPTLAKAGFGSLPVQDQWTFRVAYYVPWLFYWWMTQKWFPSSSILSGNMSIFSPRDLETLKRLSEGPAFGQEKKCQQGVYESLHRHILVSYSKWGFDPIDLKNPFPNNEGSVCFWQGQEDRMIPIQLTRFITDKLPWIKYYEVPNVGHFMIFDQDICDYDSHLQLEVYNQLADDTKPSQSLTINIIINPRPAFLIWRWLCPLPPRMCGGLPVTSPRVKLSSGGHILYRQIGVPKDKATVKVVVVHGFDLTAPKTSTFLCIRFD